MRSTPSPVGTAARITVSNGRSNPAYSPDGSKIAFYPQQPDIRDECRRVWARQFTTSGPPGPNPPGRQTALGSPTCPRLQRRRAADLEIWAINTDGTGRTQLTSNAFPTHNRHVPAGGQNSLRERTTGETDRNVYVMEPREDQVT